jgi:hypothetical protein
MSELNQGTPRFVDGPIGPAHSTSRAIEEFMETGDPNVPGL